MSLLLALLAQIGPFAAPGPQTVSPLPPEIQERKDREKARESSPAEAVLAPLPPPSSSSAVRDHCLAEVKADALQGAKAAEKWLTKATGAEKAQAAHCLGVAFSQLDLWEDAAAAFVLGRDALGDGDPGYRARLGSMAGNADLARGDAKAALAVLDTAHSDALAAGDPALAADIAIDRARALVSLDRASDAEAALAEARLALPGNVQAWLFSAALSRRLGKLSDAQQQIERASELLPTDPQIGLEAGRIAVISGHAEAARKSWQSVIDAAPESDAAATALHYLKQLETP